MSLIILLKLNRQIKKLGRPLEQTLHKSKEINKLMKESCRFNETHYELELTLGPLKDKPKSKS